MADKSRTFLGGVRKAHAANTTQGHIQPPKKSQAMTNPVQTKYKPAR